ncbi:MAG: hypothetical protein ACTSSE_16110 [Candidatus Thorarchaeota archaeon]
MTEFENYDDAKERMAKVFHKYQIAICDCDLIMDACFFISELNTNKDFPDALRGVISMIENGQHDLAIEHLNKSITELESD